MVFDGQVRAIRDACHTFERKLRTWLDGRPPFSSFSPLTISHFEEPAPAKTAYHIIVSKKQDHSSLAGLSDVNFIGQTGGAVPEEWSNGQSGEDCLKVYKNAVHYKKVYQDTMFVLADNFEVFSINGLLKVRYQSTLQRGIYSICCRTIKDLEGLGPVSDPRKSKRQNNAALLKQIERAKDPTRKSRISKATQSLFEETMTDISKGICHMVATEPNILAAQRALWGQRQEEPAQWFIAG